LKRILIDLIYIVLGSILMTISVNSFLLPNQLSSGGFSGIATILYYFYSWPVGTVIFILNIPLFIWSFFKLGRIFIVKTIITIVIYSVLLNSNEGRFILTHDKLLASIYGGACLGLGMSLNFIAGSSSGGTDILANIIKNGKNSFNLSELILIIDAVIILANVIIFKNIEIVLYSMLAIYISSKVIDIAFEGIYFSKAIYIISDKSEEISKHIIKEIGRGVTGLDGRGMYTQKEKLVLLCVTNRRHIPKIKEIAKAIDKNCFIIIYNVREVYGEGFKN